MRLPPLLALTALLGAACATARAPGAPAGAGAGDLPGRLAARAAALLGQPGPFQAGGARFPADCSGFVSAVYEAEGVPLRRLMARAAPRETSGVAAAHQAAQAYGIVFGGGGAWPQPGDLVFFRDTYDRDRDGKADDPFTHVGVVERVEGGSVTFLHRGGRAVVRATLTPDHPDAHRAGDGRTLNTVLRDKHPRLPGAPALAGQLFQGYGRIDPERIPRDVAGR